MTYALAQRRPAVALVYTMVLMIAFTGFTALAVDYGRVQLVKTELSIAADAAARAGAGGLSGTTSGASASAVATAAMNKADGQPVTLNSSTDVEIGSWSDATQVFTKGNGSPNAVRIYARRTASRGNAVATTFALLFGQRSMDVTVTAIAKLETNPQPSSVTNKSNPWLAGMPSGTTANGYDSAPTASPTLLASSGLSGGQLLTFEATGQTSNQKDVEAGYAPDGNLSWIIHNYAGAEHGLADLQAPISSLIGVFLDDNQPSSTPSPETLDFTTASSRDFSQLSPKLKQPFFIGDAKRADGTVQKFVVPQGATRLYVGSMDGQQWSDNDGGFAVTITSGIPSYRVVGVR